MKILNFITTSWTRGLAILVMSLTALVSVQAQSSYSYSTDGSEVTDSKTGLIWRRCSAGLTWSAGGCVGSFTQYTHESALMYAATQSGWRLPNVKELASLVDTSRLNTAIDTTAFPNTAIASYWSSTPDVQQSSSAWSVEFGQGVVNTTGRNTAGVLVRLVR